MTRSTIVYLVIALVMAIAFALGLVDHDAGGYPDGPYTTATFPDKAVHAVCGVGLTFAMMLLVQPFLAVAITALAGALLELGQSRRKGYFSLWDLAADVAGAGLVWAYVVAIQAFT